MPSGLTNAEAGFTLTAVLAGLIYALVRGVRESKGATSADPWPEELDRLVKAPQAVPLCTNCLFPQEGRHGFCPHCAFPTGDLVPMSPFLQVFVIGELFRRGVMGAPEKGLGPKAFLVVISVCEYSVFAPLYWFWMWRKSRGQPICMENRGEIADPAGGVGPSLL